MLNFAFTGSKKFAFQEFSEDEKADPPGAQYP